MKISLALAAVIIGCLFSPSQAPGTSTNVLHWTELYALQGK